MLITYGFIYRIKLFFSQIGYKPQNQVTEEQLYEQLFLGLSFLKSFSDMSSLIMEYQYCNKHLAKINKMLNSSKKRELFDDTIFKKNDLYDKFDEQTNIVITNIINKKDKQYTIFNPFNEQEEWFYDVEKKHNRFILYTDSTFVGISKENYFSINHLNGSAIIKLKLEVNDNGDFLFINSIKNSSFEIRNEDGFIELYDLDNSTEESVATICSDIYTEKKDNRGIQTIWMDEEADYELSLLLTLGVAELTYNYFKKMQRRINMMRYMTMKNLSR